MGLHGNDLCWLPDLGASQWEKVEEHSRFVLDRDLLDVENVYHYLSPHDFESVCLLLFDLDLLYPLLLFESFIWTAGQLYQSRQFNIILVDRSWPLRIGLRMHLLQCKRFFCGPEILGAKSKTSYRCFLISFQVFF